MKFSWYGDKATRVIRAKLGRNLDSALETYSQLVQAAISIQGPPRSEPGEPPHIDTHQLIESWTWVTDVLALRGVSGTNTPYAGYLETGTPRMAPRPFIVSTLLEHETTLARIIARP